MCKSHDRPFCTYSMRRNEKNTSIWIRQNTESGVHPRAPSKFALNSIIDFKNVKKKCVGHMIGYYAYLLRYDADIKPYLRSLFKWYIHHKFFKYNVSNLSYRPDTKQSWASTRVDHEMHKTLRRMKIKIWRRPRLAPLHTKRKKNNSCDLIGHYMHIWWGMMLIFN